MVVNASLRLLLLLPLVLLDEHLQVFVSSGACGIAGGGSDAPRSRA